MAKKRSRPKKLLGAVRLGRPINAIMVFFAAVIGGLLAGLPLERTILPALSASFISMGAQAVNDYFDVEIDRNRGRRRPLVEGILNLKEARITWLTYFTLGLLLAILASPYHLLVALIAVGLSYFYSSKIQAKKYIGNIVVSFLVALSIVYGGIGGKVENTFLPAIIIFLVNWGREIYKDITDGNVDYPKKLSLFHILGREWANFFASYLVFLGVILTPFPYIIGYVGAWYAWLMGLASLIALLAIAKALRKDEESAEKILKVGMIVALVAFLAGVVP